MRRRLVGWSLCLALCVACGGSGNEPPLTAPSPAGSATASRPVATTPGSTPTATNAGFRFIVVGDFGSGDQTEAAVAAAVKEDATSEGIDALVTTGDNVYPAGEPASFAAAWQTPYGWVEAAGVEVIASLGNHDVASDGGIGVMQLLDMPGPWYSRKVGDAELFVLDGNRPTDQAQLGWLQRALGASSAKWRIAVFHQPAYSCSEHDGLPDIQQLWVPLLEAGGVDLVLNGHDHNYQRFESPGGVTYVVTGGGGSRLYPLDECEGGPGRVVGDDRHHHFVVVEEAGGSLRVEAVATDGAVLDQTLIGPAAP